MNLIAHSDNLYHQFVLIIDLIYLNIFLYIIQYVYFYPIFRFLDHMNIIYNTLLIS
jgi:hypothetical protein